MYQNAAEVIALAVLNTICILIGGLEVMDARRWLSRLDQNFNFPIRLVPLRIALYLEIAMTVVQVVFALIFMYLSYAVVKEFGWVIYKKIGPDVIMQRKLFNGLYIRQLTCWHIRNVSHLSILCTRSQN